MTSHDCAPLAARGRLVGGYRGICSLPWLVAIGLAVVATAPLSAEQAANHTSGNRKVALPAPSDLPPVLANPPAPSRLADYKSGHFLLHTDLKTRPAHELLNRLETMLGLISKYWGQPPVGIIECYVVDDLTAWPPGSLEPAGLAKIEEGAGVTLVQTLNVGARAVAAKAIVYAKYGADPLLGAARTAADRGTPQHEAVHAYCGQAFGRTGPLWYAEGMAEMGRYWRPGDTSVHCDSIVVEYLRSHPPKPLPEILADRAGSRGGDSWQNYAWRWALCHLLENNPNYAARFRALGLGLLSDQRIGFADIYGSMMNELAFEYQFFVRHLDVGYRVDLCRWEWNCKFKEPTDGATAVSHVTAHRGWQPGGVVVSPQHAYDYSASGTWQTSKQGPALTADGRDGTGQLVGAILKDFVLSEPFRLGSNGSFVPPSEGQLYLRCHDQWNELADNRGTMTVKLKLAESQPQPSSREGATRDSARPAATAP